MLIPPNPPLDTGEARKSRTLIKGIMAGKPTAAATSPPPIRRDFPIILGSFLLSPIASDSDRVIPCALDMDSLWPRCMLSAKVKDFMDSAWPSISLQE